MMLLASSTLLVVTPAVADDYTLGIFGNANMDDTIDEKDIEHVRGIVDGTKEATELADANYDGQIDEEDLAQIELIINGEEKELTLIDSADRIVTVNKPITRMVATGYRSVEVIRSIKAGDKIVGVGKHIIDNPIFFPEFSTLPNIGQATLSPDLDIEKVLELKTEVVILPATSASALNEELQNKIKSADPTITVVRFDCDTPETHTDEVRKLGYIFGKKKEAEEFIGFYEGIINIILAQVETLTYDDKPKVYSERFGATPYKTYGADSSHQQTIAAAGGNDLFSDIFGSSVEIDPEEVITRNPDIIVKVESYLNAGGYHLDSGDTATLEEIRNEIINRPELANVTAVKNGQVYVITTDSIGGGRFFIGIAYLAKWFHPDLFKDLDPKAINQEYLTRFQGLDIDLEENGVFIYPPQEVS